MVLEDDNELMSAAIEPGSDLDDENKQMNRKPIIQHKQASIKLTKADCSRSTICSWSGMPMRFILMMRLISAAIMTGR